MKRSDKILIILVAIGSYLAIVIGLETVWRDHLFSISLTWIEEWQHNSPYYEYMFFRVMYYFGQFPLYIILGLIMFFSQPINKLFTFVAVLLYSAFFVFFLQLAYENPRPYWVNPNLVKEPCTVDFGNPSGHAMTSLPLYLTFWHIMTDYKFFRKYKYLKYILLVLTIGLVFTIYLSVIYLAAHAVNQILYGLLLGIVFYVVFLHVVKLHKYSGEEFFKTMGDSPYGIGPTMQMVNLLLLIVLILLYYFRSSSIDERYLLNAINACPYHQWFEFFKFASMVFGLAIIIAMSGIHLGFVFLTAIAYKDYPNKLDEINNWYKGGLLKNIYRYLLIIPFFSPILLLILIPADVHYAIFYIFKISFPVLFLGFFLFGIYFITCIKLKIANSKIYTKQVEYQIVAPPIHNV